MTHIQKIYRTELVQTHALRELTVSVKGGEFVAVTGASSTHLKPLAWPPSMSPNAPSRSVHAGRLAQDVSISFINSCWKTG